METAKKILEILFKNFSGKHTVTSLAKNIGLSRVGAWKALQKLEEDKLVALSPIGSGKTSIQRVFLRWDNILTEKNLELLLAEEAEKNQRWQDNFKELEKKAHFVILFGSAVHFPKESEDIDLLISANKNRFTQINHILLRMQKTQIKKIHATNLTDTELMGELQKNNKALIDALKKGVVLFGHQKFINFIRRLAKNERS